MRGSDTLPVFFEGADLLQQWIPEVDTVSIPRASHDLPGRNPAAVATCLVEFFTKNLKRRVMNEMHVSLPETEESLKADLTRDPQNDLASAERNREERASILER